MNPKEQLAAEKKAVLQKLKAQLKTNRGLISAIDFSLSSNLLSENNLKQMFFAQKEIYYNSEFSKFKTCIKQSCGKVGVLHNRYIAEHIAKHENCQLPNEKFSREENIKAYETAIQEFLDDKI